MALPAELTSQSLTAPINFDGQSLGISLADLELQAQQIFICLNIAEGLIPEIPDTVVESFQESLPEISRVLANNPAASDTLDEIETLLEQSKTDDKKVNPLRLMTLGEELSNSLIEAELQQLNLVLDDEVKALLAQFQDQLPGQ